MSSPAGLQGLRPRTPGRVFVRVCVASLVCVAFVLTWLLPPMWLLLALGTGLAVGLTLRFPVVGLVLLAFSVPWASGAALPLAQFPVTLTDAIVAALAVAWLSSAAYLRRSPLATTVWIPWLLLFIAAITVSVSQAIDWHASLREIVKWLELLVVYLVTVYFLRQARDVRIVVTAVILAAVTQAVFGYIQTGLGLGPEAFIRGSVLRAYGSFDQPNPYAGYLNLVIPLSVALTLCGRSRWESVRYGTASVILLGALGASGSKGAFIAGAAALGVVAAARYVSARHLAGAGAFVCLIAIWMATLNVISLGPAQRLLDAVGLANVSLGNVTDANFSSVERAAHWLAGIRMFAAHPLLGVGIGNYAAAYPAYHPRGWYAPLAHAHNYYINIAAETGLLGLVTYLLLAGSALWYSCAAMCRSRAGRHFPVVLGVLGALVATDIHNLFDVLYVHGLPTLLGLLMGLLAVTLGASRESEESGDSALAGRVSWKETESTA